MDAAHQRLLHFLGESSWDDRAVRLAATRYALEQIEKNDIVEAWIIDDTGFLKKGSHSVGVQRQYTGSAGKVTNCQVGVSLTLATQAHHVAADFELYLRTERVYQDLKEELGLDTSSRTPRSRLDYDIASVLRAYRTTLASAMP